MHKLVSHEYFMDNMQMIDVSVMSKYIEYSDVLSWNQTRNIMLCSLKPYLKKKNMTVSELFPLPIDNDGKEELTKEISNEDVTWWNEYKQNYKKDSN